MTFCVSSTYGYPSSRRNSLNRVESSSGAWIPAKTLPRSAVPQRSIFIHRYQDPNHWDGVRGNVAHLRRDSGNGTMRYSILYYEGRKGICAGHPGARETLFSRDGCVVRVRTHVCRHVHWAHVVFKNPISRQRQREREWIRTEPKYAFIGHIGCATDQISRVTFGHLVVAYVVTVHSSASELVKHASDLLRARGSLQLEREEDMRTVGGIVPVYELRHLARVYDGMEREKAVEG
jgi:hypothetical protein